MKKSKTKKILDEASYYTGAQSGNQAPETISAYEFSRDSVPTLNKLGNLKDQGDKPAVPQDLPFPMQDALRELAEIYLKAQNVRNNARDARNLPLFKGREKDIDEFRRSLNGIMVECKKLAAKLQHFSLAPRE